MGPLKVVAKYYRPYQLLIWQLSIIIAYNFKLVLDITNRDSFKVNTKNFKNEENTTKRGMVNPKCIVLVLLN